MHIWSAIWGSAVVLAGGAMVGAQTAPKRVTPGGPSQVTMRPTGVQGEWEGELAVGEARMKLVLHVSGERGGDLRARLDSPEQSVYGMEASAVSQAQGTVRFEIASVGASFEGKLGADGRSMTGEWKQAGQTFPLVFHRRSGNAAGKKPVDAISQFEGTWQGAFQNGNMRYRLQLHVTHDEEKKLSGTLDSLDQGANGQSMVKSPLAKAWAAAKKKIFAGKQTKPDAEWTLAWSVPVSLKVSMSVVCANAGDHAPFHGWNKRTPGKPSGT